MRQPTIVTITNPVDLILAQLAEIRAGNAETRKEIERHQANLRGAAKEEAKLERKLEKILAKAKEKRGAHGLQSGS